MIDNRVEHFVHGLENALVHDYGFGSSW